MFRSSDYSELAGSLATVAIACLGGPMSAVGAVLAGVVKHAQAGYEAAAPTRDLRRQVSSGIRQWADSEKLATDEVNRGLALAVEWVARFGLDVTAIAALNFDPQEASRGLTPGRGQRTRTGGRRTTMRSLPAPCWQGVPVQRAGDGCRV